jgi:hypothetical protein
MYQPFYALTILDEAHRYDFISIGEKTIAKTIIYQKTNIPGVFQLVMGDLKEGGQIDIFQISDNGDMEKVLATIIQIKHV